MKSAFVDLGREPHQYEYRTDNCGSRRQDRDPNGQSLVLTRALHWHACCKI
ncbi:hypothetical protein ENSA5_28850 [Enhygromyxa salina]|uniref:Uncharacterized protein n=1 Tax=Enhygromyxa salina TaxID=215803 RepID=A0A2S9Y2R5_9BACT|nr:hypothetical protein ENSA5_28850 [Enhygromyxa salina]